MKGNNWVVNAHNKKKGKKEKKNPKYEQAQNIILSSNISLWVSALLT